MSSLPMEKIELFDFQKEGAAWLSTKKLALLADEMGLGKSGQAITASDIIKAKRILVVCPAIARPNWHREFGRFSDEGREFVVIENNVKKWPAGKSIICSYEGACAVEDTGGYFDLMIDDEWHKLKSIDAGRAKKIIGSRGLIHKCNRTWALSGTPAPNNASEMWITFWVFGVTTLTYAQYIDRFCITQNDQYGLKILGTKLEALPELRQMLSKIMLRRLKKDVMKELPPITFTDQVVEAVDPDLELTPSFAEYAIPEDRMHELREKLQSQLNALKAATKGDVGKNNLHVLEALSPSLSTLRRYTGLQKVSGVADVIESELEDNLYHKIVIFAIHRDVIEGLRERLKKFHPLTLYGGHTPTKKQANIDKFQKIPKFRVMICNIETAGTAITLTAANHIDFIEQDWVPGNNAQAVMRVHRISQERPCFVRFWGIANSLDEKISASLKRKTKDLTQIFDAPGVNENYPVLTQYNHDYKTLSQDESSENTTNTSSIEELLK